mmetsp:Transcript_8545/g.21491  ORF Transcript_8545/g.21491 Transcript_8545/m.21491 type:complete len:633 (+) Transcript_8545:38-1936(+)
MNALLQQCKVRPGDLNGFFNLFFDNLATVLILAFSLQQVLRGFSNADLLNVEELFPKQMQPFQDRVMELIYEKSIPGLAMTMVFGNVYYSYMGARLGVKEDRKGAVTALPYGVNTPAAFAFLFTIIGPATAGAAGPCYGTMPVTEENVDAYAQCWIEAAEAGWGAGVVANFLAGILSVVMGFFGNKIMQVSPVTALLTALSGISFAFLGLAQVGTAFAEPIVGILPLFIVFMVYFGDVNTGSFPKSLIVFIVGVILGWADSVSTGDAVSDSTDVVKAWGISTGVSALSDWSTVPDYIGTIIPVAVSAVCGSLMNATSAAQAGDNYPVVEVTVADGFGTMVGAFFGTPFGTSVYIGHPAYKKMEAGIVYSLVNCAAFFIFGILGVFALISAIVPQQAVAPLIMFVGLIIFAETFSTAPSRHYPAIGIGLMPSVCDWALTNGMNYNSVGNSTYYGYVGLKSGGGAILASLVLTAICVHAIDRNYVHGMAWSVAAAVFSVFGLMHQDEVSAKSVGEPQSSYCAFRAGATTCPDRYTDCLSFGAPTCAPLASVATRFMTGYLVLAGFFAFFQFLQLRNYVGGVLPSIGEQDEKAYAEEKLKPSMVTETVKQVAAQAAEGEAHAEAAEAAQKESEDC